MTMSNVRPLSINDNVIIVMAFSLFKVRVALNLSLLCCMLFTNHANYSHNYHTIVMTFGKHYSYSSYSLSVLPGAIKLKSGAINLS